MLVAPIIIIFAPINVDGRSEITSVVVVAPHSLYIVADQLLDGFGIL